MRSAWIRVAPHPGMDVLTRDRKGDTETHGEGHEDGGRDQRDARSHRKVEEVREDPPLQKGCSPAHTSIWDFWAPELGKSKVLLFEAPWL